MKPLHQHWHKRYLEERAREVLKGHPRLIFDCIGSGYDFESRSYEVWVRLAVAPRAEAERVLIHPGILERYELNKSSEELDSKLDTDFHMCFSGQRSL